MNLKIGFKHLPDPILRHLEKQIKHWKSKPHNYHVTELIYCLRKAYYKRTHPGQNNISVQGLININRGNTFDRQWTPLFKINQKNYRVTRLGVTISGTFDFVYDDGDGPVIYDLKMPGSTFYKKRSGAGRAYKRQVAAYIALAHENGELLDIHKARILMVAENVVVDEQKEWIGMLDDWLFPRAFLLDKALEEEDPSILDGPEEKWECNPEYCSADTDYRIAYAIQKRGNKK